MSIKQIILGGQRTSQMYLKYKIVFIENYNYMKKRQPSLN